jgi:hypothetical protein
LWARVIYYAENCLDIATLKNAYLRAYGGIDNEVVIGIAQHTLIRETTGRLGVSLLREEYSGY